MIRVLKLPIPGLPIRERRPSGVCSGPALVLLLALFLVAPVGAQPGELPGEPFPVVEESHDEDLDALLEEFETEGEEPDPLEPVNRPLFTFNRTLDRFLFDPVARGYAWLVPEPGRIIVRNFFSNLNLPVVLVNEALQVRPGDAGETGARFLVNSTLGIAGLFDPAGRFGFDEHHADFGQTLGMAGIGPGPYLILPVFGPSSFRDGLGTLVDGAFRLDTWLLTPGVRLLLSTGSGLARKEETLDQLEELERSSVDFYAAIRHLYMTTREATLQGE